MLRVRVWFYYELDVNESQKHVHVVDQRDAHTRDAHPPETRTDLALASLKRSRLTDTH